MRNRKDNQIESRLKEHTALENRNDYSNSRFYRICNRIN